MKHFVIIDGHHLMYRAYWAIPRTMTTTKGQQVNAIFGVFGMLIQILKTESPDALLFCFDAGDQTFRHKEFAEYKGGRAETPDDFYDQIPHIFTFINTLGFKSVADPHYEADDFACAYSTAADKEGYRVTIVSGDRDLLQLASAHVRIAVPHKGYQMPEYFGPEQIIARYGVTPAQIPSYKGLVGDPSDNLKGVDGIGPKAASALLQQYGTIDEMYAKIADIKPSWKAKLEAGKEQAYFCERMSQLTCDIPLPFTLDQLAVQQFETEKVLQMCTDLEFHLLTKRFLSLLTSDAGKKYGIFPHPLQVSASRSTKSQDESAQLSLL